MAAAVTCTHCNAVSEQGVDARATIAIVHHKTRLPEADGSEPHTLASRCAERLARPSHPPANGVYGEVSADCDEIAPNVFCRQ